jgi:hypothetical protein
MVYENVYIVISTHIKGMFLSVCRSIALPVFGVVLIVDEIDYRYYYQYCCLW